MSRDNLSALILWSFRNEKFFINRQQST